MSGLRKVIKKEEGSPLKGDVESQEKEPLSPGNKDLGSVAGGHSPLFLARAIGSKVVGLITVEEPEEGEEGNKGGGTVGETGQTSFAVCVIVALRDVILGIIMGVMTISVLIFLDHHDVIHMQTAHNFREAAFSLLNDPETIQTLEESSDMHFMAMADYERQRKEIDDELAKLREEEEKLTTKTAEGEEKEKELGPVREEHDKLLAAPVLEFDKFCGDCKWDDKMNCEQHFQDLVGKSHLVGVSKFSVMHKEDGKCIKKE